MPKIECLQLILVDDGSCDDSGEICDCFEASDSRIKVYHTTNGGVTAARVYGVDKATGEWICFLDADDALSISSLSTMLNKSRDCDIVVGNKQIVSGNHAHNEIFNKVDRCLTPFLFLSQLITNDISQFITGRIFKKKLFDNGTINIPRELIMAEDFIMNVQLGNKADKVSVITDIVYSYHVYNESVSHTFHTSIAYEEMFTNYLQQALLKGHYVNELREVLTFQKVRALKAAFMAQKGNVDLKNEFLVTTCREARLVKLSRGWKLFLMLLPFKKFSYYFFRILDR